MNHDHFMHRCLELAYFGRGKVGNGALVGSVLVREGKIIAEAFHSGFGKLHSERLLLEKFDQQIDTDDVLYVSLEPCCHTGKTPPCTDILLKRGVKNLIYGMLDPDPRVAGKGIELLRNAGVNVQGPVSRASCERLNRGFIAARNKNRPWVTLKRAQTRDGAVAKPDGSPLKITNREQDVWSHTFLRSRLDAILVGVGTVEKDDPQLTPRHAKNEKINIDSALIKNEKLEYTNIDQLQPWRIILDARLRIPRDAKVVSDAFCQKTIIITSDESLPQAAELRSRGVNVWQVPYHQDHFVWEELWKTLITPVPGFDGLTSILVEGGPRTWALFRDAGMVDEEVVLVGD